MTDITEKLSAYLDGELTDEEAAECEAWLENDTDAQAQLDALMQADALAQEVFAAQLDEPVPFALAKSIRDMPAPAPVPERRPVWGAIAAGLVLFALGGAGGFALNSTTKAPVTRGWIAEVADYHAVYAGQKRHLVEVTADQSEHIEAWLGQTVGVTFTIPDFAAYDLTFEGGRLLVASGKPVAQLMYSAPDGSVIALCLLAGAASAGASPEFRQQTINGFDFVSWQGDGANYVVIGPQGKPDLTSIAQSAAQTI